jgi:hypothetical protein
MVARSDHRVLYRRRSVALMQEEGGGDSVPDDASRQSGCIDGTHSIRPARRDKRSDRRGMILILVHGVTQPGSKY